MYSLQRPHSYCCGSNYFGQFPAAESKNRCISSELLFTSPDALSWKKEHFDIATDASAIKGALLTHQLHDTKLFFAGDNYHRTRKTYPLECGCRSCWISYSSLPFTRSENQSCNKHGSQYSLQEFSHWKRPIVIPLVRDV